MKRCRHCDGTGAVDVDGMIDDCSWCDGTGADPYPDHLTLAPEPPESPVGLEEAARARAILKAKRDEAGKS